MNVVPDFAKATKVQKAKLTDLQQSFEQLDKMVTRALAAAPASSQAYTHFTIDQAYASACLAIMKSD